MRFENGEMHSMDTSGLMDAADLSDEAVHSANQLTSSRSWGSGSSSFKIAGLVTVTFVLVASAIFTCEIHNGQASTVATAGIVGLASASLENLGGSGCTPESPCQKCQGDCDRDEDCAEGLICFQRDDSSTLVPGCKAGGGGDDGSTDYCANIGLQNLGGSGCTAESPCQECQGDCNRDADCAEGLICFQRADSSRLVPGCKAGGSDDDGGTDYCARMSLQYLGDSACTEERPCQKCQGDCDNDAQCAEGLRCFQRSSSSTLVPGCEAGGSGDVGDGDYCTQLTLQNLGGSGCTEEHPCRECEGDCDTDDQCAGDLRCFQRSSSSSLVPGCEAGGSGDNGPTDYCADLALRYLGDSGCTEESPCQKCQGDCDSDSQCAEGLHCFQRGHKYSAVPGCESGGSGDVADGDYCFISPTPVFRRRRSSWPAQPHWKCDKEGERHSQYSLYAQWHFDEPTLSEVKASNISVAIEWEDFALAPWMSGGGVFASWTIPGGYFGAQIWGTGVTGGQFIFSIWDRSEGKSWPLDLKNCHRNCQDCGEADTTGTKCILDYPLMQFGGRYNIRLHRTRDLMTIHTRDYESYESGAHVEPDRELTGSEWTMTVQLDGIVQQVGRMLWAGRTDGPSYIGAFAEILGCRHCDELYHRETRYGPFLTEPDGTERRPVRAERLAKAVSLCERYRITGSKDNFSVTMEGGPGAIANFPADSNYHKLWSTADPGSLENLGGSSCTPESPCQKCQGDCDRDEDCAEGLICFQRDDSSTLVPGCKAGGGGDDGSTDYCADIRLQNLGGSGCTPESPCQECQGDCDRDADCAEGLICFQRADSSRLVPGCKAGGSDDDGSTDYCARVSLQYLGDSACTEERPCQKCQGDCDNDAQCAEGLRCFQRSSSSTLVPGCEAGGSGDVGDGDYCTQLTLQNLGSSGCTEERPCRECEGDCDHDAQCAGNLRCFQRSSSSSLVPGCEAGGSGDSGSTDYCAHFALQYSGDSGCTEESPCQKCQGDCDNDAQCAEGLRCFQRSSSSTLVPGCEAGGSGDVGDGDYCTQIA